MLSRQLMYCMCADKQFAQGTFFEDYPVVHFFVRAICHSIVLHTIYVTGFGKTDHIVTIDISRNTNLKYRSRHGSLVLDCSHARFAV